MNSAQLDQFVRGKRITLDDSRSSTKAYALYLDSVDPLASFRGEFLIPSKSDLQDPHPEEKPTERQNDPLDPCIYFCGNSLGLQPKGTHALISEELKIWATRGVHGHFNHPLSRPWVSAEEEVNTHMANVVGALPEEVSVMGTLTGNIHLLFASFYKPDFSKKGRYKVIIEGKAFPSDHYAVESQIQWHGGDPNNALVTISPEADKSILSTDRILQIINEHASSTAVLWLSSVQFYTGQAFDIKAITRHAQSKGILVGWDLAHAVGNITLELHEWGIDFAAWCTYKYLSSGPGGIAGIFVHEKHASPGRQRLAGWWGHDKATRFSMENVFSPMPGAAGYQLSNPSILDLTALLASLSLFSAAKMTAIRTKSVLLTGYLDHLLKAQFEAYDPKPFVLITPLDPAARGAQLSLLFKESLMLPVYYTLLGQGIVVDERKPDVIRVAPVPLYNTFEEVWEFVQALRSAIDLAIQNGQSMSPVEAGSNKNP